jgi:hypothetical protein
LYRGSWWPLAAPPLWEGQVLDAADARDDLRISRKYLDSYRDTRDRQFLDFAWRYLTQAREKDPSVTLHIKTEKSVGLLTLEHAEATLLFEYTQLLDKSNPEQRAEVINYLRRAVHLGPTPTYFTNLAQAYTLNNERAKAEATLQEAARAFPDEFKIRSAIDTLAATPTQGVEPRGDRVRAVFVIMTVLCIILAVWGYQTQLSDPTVSHGAANEIIVTAGLFARFGAIIFGIIAFFMPSS